MGRASEVIIRPPASGESSRLPPLPSLRAPASASGLAVLLIDEDPIALGVLGSCMTGAGYTVLKTSDAQAVQALLDSHPIRVVVSSWDMPAPAGPALVELIRTRGGSYISIISTTRKSNRDVLAAAMTGGSDDVLVKPFLYEVLLQRLQVAMRIIALESTLAQRNAELTALNDRNRLELEAAANVQRGLLPAAAPAIPGLSAAWRWQPSDQLGGDLLGVFALDAHHLGMYLLDVSGHGVSSALLAVQVSRFLGLGQPSLVCGADGSPAAPAAVLGSLNALFPVNLRTRQFFTISYAVVHAPSGRVRVASAGHPPPLVVHADGATEEIPVRGVAIGWLPKAVYAEAEFTLASGDRMLLYSDGVTEAEHPTLGQWQLEGLGSAAAEATGGPDALLDGVLAGLDRWCAPGRPGDDVTLLAVART